MINKNRYSDRETIPTPLGSKQLHRITCLECGCSIIGTPIQISRALEIHDRFHVRLNMALSGATNPIGSRRVDL